MKNGIKKGLWKIMLVDDNYLSLQGLLSNIDWKSLDAEVVFCKYSGTSALAALRDNEVDLIISDIKMPDLDGLMLTKHALAINPDVKIILISAYDHFEYAKSAVRLGVYDYVEKPLDYPYLTNKIRSALLARSKEKRNMEIISESRPLMIEKFFRELLLYHGKEPDLHLGRYLSYLNLNLDYPYFCTVIFSVENALEIEERLGVAAYQVRFLNVSDTLSECFSIFDSVFSYRDVDSIFCVIGQNTSNTGHFLQALHKAAALVLEGTKSSLLTLNIGIGRITDSLWDINLSYESAKHALRYRFFLPEQHVFDAKESFGQDFSLLSSTESKEEELIQLLCQKDTAAISTWLHSFFLRLSKDFPQKNILFIKIYSLLGRILKFLFELNIDTTDIEADITKVYSAFDTFLTYEDFYHWMNGMCENICVKLETSFQSYHEQVCELALSFISENFEDNTLSLNDISLHTNVSSSYLSALYKKVKKQSISDTITTFRIGRACDYLTTTNLSLKEISTKCGYANQYYFSSSFKKKMGVSPSTYREENSHHTIKLNLSLKP